MPTSAVRVYERPDRPGRIFMTRAWITTASGRPVERPLDEGITREAAETLCDLVASERKRDLLVGRQYHAEPSRTPLGKLLDAYHDSELSGRWSDRTWDDKHRLRLFWLLELGEDAVVEALSTSRVERAAQKAARARGWGARTERKTLEYLRAAIRWGYHKAQLLDADPLRGGLSLPDYDPDTRALVYRLQEALLLSTPHEDIDWRVTLAVSIVADTGRRINAVRHLSIHDVGVEDRVYLRFQREWDKKKRDAYLPASQHTALLIADALDRPEVQESEWLFPEGRIEYDDPRDKPIGRKALEQALHAAEKVLGIPYIKGRGYHALKRTHITVSWGLAGGDPGLVGDITGNIDASLIKNVYRQQDRGRISKQVDAIRAQIEAAGDGKGKG
jgi:integrase